MLVHTKESDRENGICGPSWPCAWGTETLGVPEGQRAYCARTEVLNEDERRSDPADVDYEWARHDVYVKERGDEDVRESVVVHEVGRIGDRDYSERVEGVDHDGCSYHDSHHRGDGNEMVMERACSHSPSQYLEPGGQYRRRHDWVVVQRQPVDLSWKAGEKVPLSVLLVRVMTGERMILAGCSSSGCRASPEWV